jgi:hypothetical protein
VAVFDERLPRRYDSNYLLVDELPEAVSGTTWPGRRAGRLGFVGPGRYVKLIRPG